MSDDLDGEVATGDELCVKYTDRLLSVTVIRTTRSQVLTSNHRCGGESRWRRKTGREVGKGGGYSSPELVRWTPALRSRARHLDAISELGSAIYEYGRTGRVERRLMSTEDLAAAAKHLRRAVGKL